MRLKHTVCALLLLLSSCQNAQESNDVIANEFIDAFYSFDSDRLKSTLSFAKGSQPNILYYQKWAECGNYKVIKRSDCLLRNDSLMVCPVTVEDDLMAGLNIHFNVTDTFRLTITQGRIRSVQTFSNDPDVYYEAKEWVKQNRPDLIEKACEGIWDGGPTPCECIQGMITGFKDFVAHQKQQ